MSILYNLRRMAEACREHVDNNFRPLPQAYVDEFELLRTRIGVLFNDVLTMMNQEAIPAVPLLRRHCDELKGALSANYHRLRQHLHEEDPESMSVLYPSICFRRAARWYRRSANTSAPTPNSTRPTSDRLRGQLC